MNSAWQSRISGLEFLLQELVHTATSNRIASISEDNHAVVEMSLVLSDDVAAFNVSERVKRDSLTIKKGHAVITNSGVRNIRS